MSDKDLARSTAAQVFFAGVDITDAISEYLLSITYTDHEEDETDDLQIKLHDRDDVWLLEYLNSVINAAGYGSSSGEPSDAQVHKIKSSKRVAVRAGPGASYPALGKLANGKKIIVYEIKDDWARITFNERTGYVNKKFVKYVSDVGEDQPTTENIVKGLSIQAVFVRKNWAGDGEDVVLDCGDFELDDVRPGGPPATITIRGTALPYGSTVRQTKKSKAWEGYSLSGIAAEMAETNDMACLYESAYDPFYERVEQVATSDIEFLSTLCHEAGLSLKTTNNIIVLFDQSTYEAAEPVITIPHGSAGGYTIYKLSNGSADNAYAACHVSYADPSKKGAVIEAMAYAENYGKSDDNQCLEVTAAVHSIAEAEILAQKMLRLHNKYELTGSFTFPGNPVLAAGLTAELTGWGMYDGKYIITKAKHQLSQSGYTTTINIRHVFTNEETVRVGVKYKVSASSAPVRSGPGKKYKKRGTLKKNSIVYVIEDSGGWSRITYKEKTSYVYTKHLKIVEE